MKQVNAGFNASRSQAKALKSTHPNICHFIMEVIKHKDAYVVYIATECGEGEKTLNSVEAVNEEVAKVRATFEKEGGWTISDHGMIKVA